MKEFLKKYKKIFIFVFYLIITFVLMSIHNNWRDEAQAWLLARDCNLMELIIDLKYEGHFLLWYTIIMPFAKLSFPYFTMNLISWIITSISAWIILDKAPFKFYKKALLLFMLPLIYLYPAISRCYCLIPLAITLMSIFYKDKFKHPMKYLLSIALLANTHVIMYGLVGIELLEYIIDISKNWKKLLNEEKKKIIFSLILMIFILLISIFPLLGCLSANKEVYNDKSMISKVIDVFITIPITLVMQMFYIENITIIVTIICAIICILFIEIKNDTRNWIKIMLCILFQCIVYSFIYPSSEFRTATIILIILFYKWIKYYQDGKSVNKIETTILNGCYIVLIITNIIFGLVYFYDSEIKSDFSNAYKVGEYMNNNLETNSIVLCDSRVEYINSIIPYLNKNITFYQINGNRYVTYTIWDEINQKQLTIYDIKNLDKSFNTTDNLYFIYNSNCTDFNLIEELKSKECLTEMCRFNTVTSTGEEYILYKFHLYNIINI